MGGAAAHASLALALGFRGQPHFKREDMAETGKATGGIENVVAIFGEDSCHSLSNYEHIIFGFGSTKEEAETQRREPSATPHPLLRPDLCSTVFLERGGSKMFLGLCYFRQQRI